ncbi:alpha/beta hydrolase [Enterobacter cloacae]|jgi:pimeloyl-ACP methyl ester carboxylesterase|uniref:alpha/beta hydrolase n=1 Tax=Enterobacter TaxID=547 RepID=UPI0004A6F492|nr:MULTISPECIES: alpha/beta hydrolase [Enterobacter]EGS1685774.1 alpha/beta hydrolase [Enterobacter cloacae]EKK5412604.1 alpha/beta hydrolase [Enterobacter cloacae]EKS9201344.1 alpha/beta hydrolase [Enterobacter cloacae]EKV5782989.1 alpha/beta hydrolase [Enterobacter cloacae]EKX4142461.1 alpha/beta hydrolase [Enterobacter cloacae]
MRKQNLMSVALRKGVFALCLLFMSNPPLMAQDSGVKNIVLVHGAFADGSNWSAVIALLQDRGYHVTAVQNPLTSLREDVAATERVLERQNGNVLLVGHSWAGAVITQAGNANNVKGLVYLSALVPDSNQSVSDALAHFNAPMKGMEADKNGLIWLDKPQLFHQVMANELSMKQSLLISAVQQPIAAAAFNEKVNAAAWREKPSWYLITENDNALNPLVQANFAREAGAHITRIHSDHLSMISHPKEVAALIVNAAQSIH